MRLKKVTRFFDVLEDSIRARFSKHPIFYSIFGGIGVILFWRGVWETADILSQVNIYWAYFFFPPVQIAVSAIGLLLTGLMVSTFIGHRILLSGLRHEKKLEEQTDELVKEEVITLAHIREEIRALKKEVEKIAR
ncbi:MAG: hypothetical protein RLZZ67_281 [Candidatus Parcubacteria bacterium]|jgi:hypothetical protein